MKSRLLHTASFRYATLSASVFAAGMLIFSAVVFYGVESRMEQQLREHIRAESSQLLGDYAEHGLDELRHDIGERLERAPVPRLRYTIVNPQGEAIFDRMPVGAPGEWQYLRPAAGPALILLTTGLNDGYRLGVAAETIGITEFARAFRHSILLALLAILLFSSLAGILISKRFLARVERLRLTAEQVRTGALSARIPTKDIGDDFEQLAVTINGMLDRIEELVHNLRYVSVSIAHDLRTPLGRLRQRLETIESQQTTEVTQAACIEAIAMLDETLNTFSALLRIGELEAGSLPIASEPVDLNQLLGKLYAVYQPVAEEKHQSLLLETPQDPLVVPGDRPLLMQLFANLIENAINHNHGGLSIHLGVQKAGEYVKIEVTDNGVGIAPEHRQAVLKPFYKTEHARGYRGSGLGLSLADRIARRHQGQLRLEDNQPGLRVVVELPSP